MTKKDFTKINPVMQFITTPEEQEQQAAAEAKKQETETQKPQLEEVTNITIPLEQYQELLKAAQEHKKNPKYVEKKTKRLQLIVQPSLHAAVKQAAKKAKLSINEYCHRVLEEAAKGDKNE